MSSSLFDLRGRVVIVTGGAVGIGKVYAERLVEAGARVVIADVAAAEGEALAARLGAAAVSVPTDISDPAAVERMVEATLARFGRIDGLVNNASLMSVLPRRSWLEIPVEEWDRVMAVNLRGLFLCCRAAVPAMRQQGRGRIVTIASTRVFEGTPNRLHYTTSKAGVVGFTRALAREVGADGITVNCIAPGRTLSETQIAGSDPAYLTDGTDALRAISRPQVPDDLVGALLFLLSDASAFVTGQTLVVDGGKVMH
ncbi:MAG: SDR family NAD(P)-dependent oxidoreductase [Acidobacteriota bacterium]